MRAHALMTFFLLLAGSVGYGQSDPRVEKIIREGKELYRAEITGWYASDIYRNKFSRFQDQTGGYFAYAEGSNTKCVFYSSGKIPEILATFTFDSTMNAATVVIDSTERPFSARESGLFNIRKAASYLVNRDTLFKVYEGSSLNLVPLSDSLGKRVYVLTAPNKTGVVIMGNDYIIRFDNSGKITGKKALHQGIFFFHFKDGDDVSFHSHNASSGEYITPTDICTLLLYERFTPWKQHVVISESKVSIWNIGTEELTVIPRKMWDEIMSERNKQSQ